MEFILQILVTGYVLVSGTGELSVSCLMIPTNAGCSIQKNLIKFFRDGCADSLKNVNLNEYESE